MNGKLRVTTLSPEEIRYTGKPYSRALGAYVFNARAYDAATSRWTTPDPSGFPDGVNNRVYAATPTFQMDADGLIVIGIYGMGNMQGNDTQGNADMDAIASSTKATMYFRDQKSAMKKAIAAARKSDPKTPVIIYGYSRGGVAAVEVAKQLKDVAGSCCIDLLGTHRRCSSAGESFSDSPGQRR